jgi:Predicted nucleotidyltransferases
MTLTIVNDPLKIILAQLKRELKNHYGDRLKQLIMFGSQARGDAHPDSDIDVLVVLK